MNITVRSMPQVRHDKYLGVLGKAPKSHPTAAFSEICHPLGRSLSKPHLHRSFISKATCTVFRQTPGVILGNCFTGPC